MKKLLTRTGIGSIGAVRLRHRQRVRPRYSTSGAIAQKEALLTQSGFRVITVTTPQQQQAIAGLAQGRVTAVKYKGKTFYVFPTGTKEKTACTRTPNAVQRL